MADRELSSLERRQLIWRLNRIDPTKGEYSTILDIIRKMAGDLNILVSTSKGQELFYRARVAPKNRPELVSELHAPPAALVQGFQRCNPPGVPMFYAASRRVTALLECNVQPGQRVYLSEWIGQDEMPVNRLLDPESDTDTYAFSETQGGVRSYLDTIFTRRIHKAYSDDYKFTAAASQFLTTNFPQGKQNIREDGLVALKYPSVVDIERSYNTAMHASFAESRLQILHVMEIDVISRSGNSVEIKVIDNARAFTDGRIDWLGNKDAIPAPTGPKGEVRFVHGGASWLLEIRDQPSSAEDIIRMLDE